MKNEKYEMKNENDFEEVVRQIVFRLISFFVRRIENVWNEKPEV